MSFYGGLRVGDVVSIPVIEYRWWEKALRKLSFGRYRPKGVEVRRDYTITSAHSA